MKGLEALKAIEDNFLSKSKTYNSLNVGILNIKTGKMYAPKELTEIVRKALKALEIIVENYVQISWFTTLLKNFPHYTHEDYNFALPDNMQLSKEEYEILKEVLA